MSVVVLVFDQYGIDETPAIIATIDQLQTLREQIDRHLRTGKMDCLRIRLKPEYRQRFADFIGLRGVDCLDFEPCAEFAKRFGFAAPPWAKAPNLARLLTNPILFKERAAGASNAEDEGGDSTFCILKLVNPDLTRPENWASLCAALADPLLAEFGWLAMDEVMQRIEMSAAPFLQADAAKWFVGRVASFAVPAEALVHLARQRFCEHLRGYTQGHRLSHALPARIEPSEFLNALPAWPVNESDAGQKLVDDWLAVLELATHAIEAGSLPVSELAGLAVVDWPSVIDALERHLAEHRRLATVELAGALNGLGSEPAVRLAATIREQLASCEALPENADTETTRLWLKSYLDYARRRFTAEQEPDEFVSMSFSSWVLRQQARIARSPMDWRHVARIIGEQLRDKDTRVIVCMVDALSALYNAQVRDTVHDFASSDDLVVEENFLIAPYPSLTEIGKNAVLTGKPSDQTSGTVENRLYQTFEHAPVTLDEICLLKSWESRDQIIPKQTRLLVYLENRIDDRLHDCASYSKFNADVEVIVRQLGKEIKRWTDQTRRHGLEPVVLITADHGVTYIREVESAASGTTGKCNDRCIDFPSRPNGREDFEITEAGGKHYLIPLRRVRLQGGTPMAHGGLTPEELLIPCIVMRRPFSPAIPLKPPLQIRLGKEKAITLDGGWQLCLVLQSHCDAHTVRIEASPPFRGKAGPYGPLQKGKQEEIPFALQTDLPQEGLVQVELTAKFSRPDLHSTETLFFKLDVLFPPRLLEKSDAVAEFENMF